MNKVMMRIQCLQLSEEMRSKFSALKMTREEIAEGFASFAMEAGESGIEPRMAALGLALPLVDRRAPPGEVIRYARELVEFAEREPNPEVVAKPTTAPVRKKRGKRTKISR